MTVAILGLGEAGGEIAGGLAAAGVRVSAWDPAVDAASVPPGVGLAGDAVSAVRGATAVLSVNAAAVAVDVAREVAHALEEGQLYADLNTAAPALKAEVATVVEPSGALFADVALMAPVPGRGLKTPCLISGSGAARFAELFGARFGMPVDVVDDAAGRKLLRSVFMKGVAAATIESLAAARAAGHEEWLRDEIARVLDAADAGLLDRLLTGSRRHAGRRVHEMQAASEMLTDLGVEPRVCAAAVGWLAELQAEHA